MSGTIPPLPPSSFYAKGFLVFEESETTTVPSNESNQALFTCSVTKKTTNYEKLYVFKHEENISYITAIKPKIFITKNKFTY